jgi:uncharacterized lipoprotein YajG
MKRTLFLLAAIALLSGCQSAKDPSGTAYFKVAGATEADMFVIALTDPDTIAEARTRRADKPSSM